MRNMSSPYLFIFIFVMLWTLVASLFSYILPLDVIENLSWGQLWQWGYYKHPPLQAWQQEAMVVIFGRKDWPAFFLSFLNIGVALYFLYKIARQIALPLWLAQLMPVLAAFIYYYNIRGIEFNANVATLPLSLAYISCFIAAVNQRKLMYWLILGAIAALGLLAKYSFAILLFSSLPAILFIRPYRLLFWHWGPYLSICVMGLLLWPHINWLYEVDFLPFTYIKDSVQNKPDFISYLVAPLVFVILQIAVLLPSFLALWLLAQPTSFKQRSHKQSLALALVVLPLLVFMILGWFFSSGVRTFWGYTIPMGLVLFVMIFDWQPRENFAKKAHIFRFVVLILPCMIFILLWALGPYVRDKGKRTDADGYILAQMAQNYWQSHTKEEKLPLWIVTNTHWAAEVISWYTPHRPRLIYVQDDVLSYKRSPWVEKQVDIDDPDFKAFWIGPHDTADKLANGFCIESRKKIELPWRHKGYIQKIEYDFGIYKRCKNWLKH